MYHRDTDSANLAKSNNPRSAYTKEMKRLAGKEKNFCLKNMLKVLDQMVVKLIADGHKTLIFSQVLTHFSPSSTFFI